jgi:hypothetical protein
VLQLVLVRIDQAVHYERPYRVEVSMSITHHQSRIQIAFLDERDQIRLFQSSSI